MTAPFEPNDPLGLPDAVLMFADTLLVFDHVQHVIKVVSHVRLDGPLRAGPRNHFFHGAAVGGVPQDLKYKGGRTGVRLGAGKVIRLEFFMH